jgi:hypothetical protein
VTPAPPAKKSSNRALIIALIVAVGLCGVLALCAVIAGGAGLMFAARQPSIESSLETALSTPIAPDDFGSEATGPDTSADADPYSKEERDYLEATFRPSMRLLSDGMDGLSARLTEYGNDTAVVSNAEWRRGYVDNLVLLKRASAQIRDGRAPSSFRDVEDKLLDIADEADAFVTSASTAIDKSDSAALDDMGARTDELLRLLPEVTTLVEGKASR